MHVLLEELAEPAFDFGAKYDGFDRSNLPRDWKLKFDPQPWSTSGRVDVLGKQTASLDIQFNDDSSPKQNRTIKSIDWSAVGRRRSERNATDKDYESVVLHTKYILITENHIDYRTYGRNDGVWRLRDIMTAILDMERYYRMKTYCNNNVDAHAYLDAHIYLDAVSCMNSVVTYRFGS
jgi:hypothetical protein